MMEEAMIILTIADCRISVTLGKRLVRVTRDDNLLRLLSHSMSPRTTELVQGIKEAYHRHFGIPLRIGDDSMAVEIWGHVYAERFTLALQKALRMAWMDKVARFVVQRSDKIDCGERSLDRNRFFWDLLGPCRGLLGRLLPRFHQQRV